MLRYRLFSVLAAILLTLTCTAPLVSAAQLDDGFISGYVREGLYSETKLNFTDAISAYRKADSHDRYAWVRLAKAYRALDAYGDVLLQRYCLEQQARAIDSTFVNFGLSTYEYTQLGSDREVFGGYSAKDPQARSSFSVVRCGWLTSPRLIGNLWSDLNMYTTKERLEARLLPGGESSVLSRKKETAWNSVEANEGSAWAWLQLGRACKGIDPREAEAAFNVVLLSSPESSIAEAAQLEITRICSPVSDDSNLITDLYRNPNVNVDAFPLYDAAPY
jgi:tetratricopeptide (TPR) repeat protein